MDVALRDAERAVALGVPGARERLVLERLRAGAPDPRVDPTRGAEVQALGRWNGRHCSRVTREVLRVWPGRLAISLPCVLRYEWAPANGGPIGRTVWLPRATPVFSVAERSWHGEGAERQPDTWLMVAEMPGQPGRYAEWVATDEPEVYGQESALWADRPALDVELVEWMHVPSLDARRCSRRPQRSTLAQWRKWAKGASVLRLGDAMTLLRDVGPSS